MSDIWASCSLTLRQTDIVGRLMVELEIKPHYWEAVYRKGAVRKLCDSGSAYRIGAPLLLVHGYTAVVERKKCYSACAIADD